MSIDTERFIATFQLIEPDRTATSYFRDFLAKVDGFIQQAAVVSTWGGIGGTLADQSDLQTALDSKIGAYEPPAFRNEATDPYTFVIGDANKVTRLTAAAADVTIPVEASVDFDIGSELWMRFAGTGTPTLDTTGLTINGTIPTLTQHLELRFRKVAADDWDLLP